jgi:hypothetical protein
MGQITIWAATCTTSGGAVDWVNPQNAEGAPNDVVTTATLDAGENSSILECLYAATPIPGTITGLEVLLRVSASDPSGDDVVSISYGGPNPIGMFGPVEPTAGLVTYAQPAFVLNAANAKADIEAGAGPFYIAAVAAPAVACVFSVDAVGLRVTYSEPGPINGGIARATAVRVIARTEIRL